MSASPALPEAIIVDAPLPATRPSPSSHDLTQAHAANTSTSDRHPSHAVHSPNSMMDAVTAAAAMGALPAANGLPSDPAEASSVSRLFAHPPAPDPAPASTPASTALLYGSAPVSPNPTSPTRTPAAPHSLRSAASPSSHLASPASERANPIMGAGVAPSHLAHSLHQHQQQQLPASADASTAYLHNASGFRSPTRSRLHGTASPAGTSPPNLTAPAHPGAWHHPDHQSSHTPHTPRSPSIFERDIEHRDASHIMTAQEATDVAIPSVLDDAVEAIIEDDAEIEVVAPQNPAPPLALSSAALSVHSGASSPSLGFASSPSPPLSASGPIDAPPGSMAAQIAEKLGPRGVTTEEAIARRTVGAPRRPGSDIESGATSLRSRSPQATRMVDMADGGSPVRSRASPSPVPAMPPVSLVAAVSQAQAISPLPPSAGASSPMPTATAFPSLPLPNPYRSSSPNLSAMALPSLAAGADAGRPATSSVSIDGAIISGTEVATLDHSLETIADVLAAHDAEQAASPYVPRSPAPPAISGSSSPVVDRSRSAASSAVRQPLHHPGMGAAAGANRAAAPGTLGLPASSSGLGVFSTGESLFQALASGSPSPSADKRRLSFFSYADILNENKGEVMDLQGVVRHSAERDEQQHGIFHAQPHAQAYGHADASAGPQYDAFTSQPSIMQQLGGGAGMSRSVSTSAAASPRIGGFGARSTSGSSATAGGAMSSGAYTPARGRRDYLENKALSNRLDSLQLATSTAAATAAEAKTRKAA
ncbi:hypothetical protein PaG_04395 [Moesziomyces aphidis]|uniref:Uncharacterized protein n=1 Tax=Moesziomyces aphidis TaxID=84754 RepID=W3VI74_MOEAP|nr:hypothetical protein PaG_04395 [Moesziomyces aphidis]